MNRSYVSVGNTVECTRVIIDTEESDFVAFRFYNNNECIVTCYASCPEDKQFATLTGIEFKDKTILLEAEHVQTDTSE